MNDRPFADPLARNRLGIDRRRFVQAVAAAVGCATIAARSKASANISRRVRIVLRSSWQTVNIGDIAHTPGVLALLEKYLPDVEVRLWPSSVGDGVEEILKRRFPKVAIIRGKDEIARAMDECDFLLHGSGPSLVAAKDVARWREETGKPYGVFGITVASIDEQVRSLLSDSRFVYFRDSVSLQLAKSSGVTCPVMAMGPDGAFAVDLRDDERADAFLEANQLTPGKFLCCIPRLRYTPYWKIKNQPFNQERHDRNEAMKEHDHAPLRAAIRAVTDQGDYKVLICPEDRSQMAVGKEMLYDPLPDQTKRRVVWREDYWLTDQALSTYTRSAGLFGLEMHSPIMCIGNGVPAIVCRFAEQTSKGLMWRDIGLGDWLFDMDQEDEIERIVPAVLSLVTDPAAAQVKAKAAAAKVKSLQQMMTNVLSQQLRTV